MNTQVPISSDNLFRLSRDVEKLGQLLGFIFHQVIYPGSVTTTQESLMHIPSEGELNRAVALSLGYKDYDELVAMSLTHTESVYPTFSEISFSQAFSINMFELISDRFKTLPRDPRELQMINEMLDSFLNIVRDQERYTENIVGKIGSGKTLYLKQWLVEYARFSDLHKQQPVIVFCRDNFAYELRNQRADLFSPDKMNVIEAQQDFSNVQASLTDAPINVITVEPLSKQYSDERLHELSLELLDSQEQSFVLIDEFYLYIGAAVAFKDSKHHSLSCQQTPVSPDGQTLYSPKDFIWRIIDPKSLTEFMYAIGAWEDVEEFMPLAEKMMSPSEDNHHLSTGAAIVRGNSILTLPVDWKMHILHT